MEVKLHSHLTLTLGVVGGQHHDPAALPSVCCDQKALWNSGPVWEGVTNPESSISQLVTVPTELPLLQREGNEVLIKIFQKMKTTGSYEKEVEKRST
jgi:hypothetical protein